MLRLNGQFCIDTSAVHGDKSILHRALIFSAIATGKSVIRNLTLSEDILATVDCLRVLGAKISIEGNCAEVTPITQPNTNVVLDCKNSGTTARLLAGLVAGLGVKARFTGDGSLEKRPMRRVLDPLTQLGAEFCKTDGCLFECVGGKIHGGTVIAQVNSAQVKSAVLIAGLFCDGKVTYAEKVATRNHTEIMLSAMGADITTDGLAVSVSRSTLNPIDFAVPNDISSAAFLIAAALIKERSIKCRNVLLNDRRNGFLRVLEHSGADIGYNNVRFCCGEKVGDIIVEKSRLQPLYADMSEICDAIDEIPVMAAVALTVKGKHTFENVAELQHKESNRIEAIIHMARVCNQQADFDGVNLTVVSNGILPKNPRFCGFNDHRIAMSEVLLCLAAGGGSVDVTPFEVSFPEFCKALGIRSYKFGLIGENVNNSRSPQLMEYLAKSAGISCSYDLINVPVSASDGDLLSLLDRFDGLNVTMPFKKKIAELTYSEGTSVNTVGKHIKPQSTDGYGIIKSLDEAGIKIDGKPVYVVGAGGAAEICVETLLKRGCKIKIINRDASHAEVLARKYNLRDDITEPYGILSFVPECEFEQSIVLPLSCQFVFVAAYKGQSGLKKQAIERGITYVDGLRMLYHQGAKSFSVWTNTPLQNDYDGFVKFLTCEKFAD